MRKSKIGVILVVLAVVFILAMLGYRIASNFKTPAAVSDDTPVNVKTAQAALASISVTSPVSGRIQPIEEVVILPLASGEVKKVYVQMGDRVEKGTTLFEIDKTQISTTLNQAREAHTNAATAYERMELLYKEGAVSLQAFEQAKAAYVTTKESYNAASNAYNNTMVKSPIAGYVTSLSVSAGSIASPAAPAAIVANVSELKIDTTVSEFLAPKLKVGDPVKINIATLSGRTYSGTITAISPAPAIGSLTYPVRISVDNESGDIMAGMFAEINIISDEKDNVLCIPSDAVIIKSGKPVVVVIKNSDMPEFREVTTGIDNGEIVEITSGLSEGETIVTVGQHFVKEGVAVNVIL